jgi:hypothetical protein
MKPLLRAVVLLATVLCVVPAQSEDTAKQVDYYPLALGNQWVYRTEVNGDRGYPSMMSKVGRIDQVNGQPEARIDCIISGETIVSEYYVSTDKGILHYGCPPDSFDPPVFMLRYPIKVGDSWNDTRKVALGTATFAYRVEKVEEIEVPAGKFNAVKVDSTTKIKNTSLKCSFWFADGVGLVKFVVHAPNREVTQELEKFQKAETGASIK